MDSRLEVLPVTDIGLLTWDGEAWENCYERYLLLRQQDPHELYT